MPDLGSVLAPETPVVTHRAFGDVPALRTAIFDNVLQAAKTKYPIENARYRLELRDLAYKDDSPYDLKAQKQAIVTGGTLDRRLVGAWHLVDKATNKVVDKKSTTIAHVPYLTDRGTFIYGGNDYVVANQSRLKPGVFARQKENGILEAHFNAKPGTGQSFRLYMEPETGVFRLGVGQSALKLYPILRAMGASDKDIEQHWGQDLLQKNIEAEDPRAVGRAFAKLVHERAALGAESDESASEEGQEKTAQRDQDRRWTYLWFKGALRVGKKDSWVLLDVNKGLCRAAYESLKSEHVECEPEYDEPHITVLRPEEVEQLKLKFGERWQGAAKVGSVLRYRVMKIVSLVPEGWDDVHRVWFLECESPDLQRYRTELGFTKLPRGSESNKPFRFHITFAVHRNGARKAAELLDCDRAMVGTGRGLLEKKAEEDAGKKLTGVFDRVELDPDVTESTLGTRYANAGLPVILRASQKLLNISHGTEDVDDRDSLAFQTFHGPEDFFAERITKDAGMIGRKLLWKATLRGNLKHVSNGALTPQMRAVLLRSGLGNPLEETNPLEIHDQHTRVLRTGEGAISSLDAIPDAARSVQPSHFGYIDPIRSPESERVGVDARVAHGALKGSDGQIYTTMLNVRIGKPELVSAPKAAKSVVAFPGELGRKSAQVRAMVRSKQVEYVKPGEVDYALPSANQMFATSSNLVPMISASKGGRLSMGARYLIQALPLQNPEAPLVQNLQEGDKSFDDFLGEKMGAVRARDRGVVTKMDSGGITVRYPHGEETHELYVNFPFNRRTVLHNTPAVKIGDRVAPGQLLASSNYTDAKGTAAMGSNLRTAYMAYKGLNYEDAAVISESAARKLSSEHLYQHVIESDESTVFGHKEYVSIFPAKFTRPQLANLDKQGVVKPGSIVRHGDPLILSLHQYKHDAVHRGHTPMFTDAAETWDHPYEGQVTDVSPTKEGGWNVMVKGYVPAQEGDKLSGRLGDKGVISKIVSDDRMPHDKNGQPFDLLLNPQGVITRGNPAQIFEALLGKVARKTGQPYKLPSFRDGHWIDFVKAELQKAGLSDTEDLTDPETGRRVPKVLTGERYMLKLLHTAESKGKGRDVGAYTAEGLPARGGDAGSKRVALMEINSLLSHGATGVLRDAQTIRGQRNDDYWRAFRMGYVPPSPKVPLVYNKFLGYLQGAGINLRKQGSNLQVLAMTDADVEKLSAGEIKVPETVKSGSLEEIPGGLFDKGLTGGHDGTRWSHVTLAEPIPNPIMEEPIRRMLGLTKKKFEAVLAGSEQLNGRIGGDAIREALAQYSVDDNIEHAKEVIGRGARSKRDNAVKVLGYLNTMKKNGMKPTDLILRKVPVIPPAFRPVTPFNGNLWVGDPNYLYMDLMRANEDLKAMTGAVNERQLGHERLQLYNAYKAVTGLGDPVQAKTQERGVRGLLAHVFGGSPKAGMFQRRVLGAPVDVVGRATITPNPELGMDQVGLPEDKAWTVYRPFIVRRLIRSGMPATNAAKAVADQDPVARKAMLEEMAARPVMINRAPTLHRYGFMSAWPVLTKGGTLQIPPVITAGMGADFDGNCILGSSKLVVDFCIKGGTLRVSDGAVLSKIARIYKTHFTGRTSVVQKHKGGAVVEAEIKDFPRIVGSEQRDKNGALVYAVPEGLKVWTIDLMSGQPIFAPVTHVTVEQGAETVEVATRRKFKVTASANESLCVYDHVLGECVKCAPKGALGALVPIAAKQPVQGAYGDLEFGWMLGAFVSDGFLMDDRSFGYAKVLDAQRDRFAKAVAAYEGYVPKRNTYRHGAVTGTNVGIGAKDHYYKTKRALALFAECYVERTEAYAEKRSCLRKKLPDLTQYSEEALIGILNGLIDGDGTLGVLRSKSKPQISAAYSTSSPFLVESIRKLCRLLGLRMGVSSSEPKKGRMQKETAYTVFFSTPELRKLVGRMIFSKELARAAAAELRAAQLKDDRDIVPVPIVAVRLLCAKKNNPDNSLRASCAALSSKTARPSVSRGQACKMLSVLNTVPLSEADAKIVSTWSRLVQAAYLQWDIVTACVGAGKAEVYDLVVPEYKVFVANGGLVVFDTLNYHVPVADEAVQDAVNRMMPSKNLWAVRDFKVHYLPRNEFLMGLHLASASRKQGEPRVFRSRADALAAYHRGELEADDRVIVK